MAVPLAANCDTVACPTQDSRVLVSLILTVLYGIIFAFTLFAFPDTTEQERTPKTPKQTKRNAEPTCPDAPKAKRQRTDNSPALSPVARNLFADTNNADTEAICPGAPLKTQKKATKKHAVKSVATQLDFTEAQVDGSKMSIAFQDIRTKPSHNDTLSPETETICSFYKPGDNVFSIEAALNKDADTIDPTNPDRIKPNVKITDIINYLLSLNRLIQNMRVLNDSRIALPHAGTGESTTRNDEHYYLVDKMFNAAFNTGIINAQLSSILADVYANNKTHWTTIPTTYVEACQLSREVAILGNQLQREVSYNMNLTPWSDW